MLGKSDNVDARRRHTFPRGRGSTCANESSLQRFERDRFQEAAVHSSVEASPAVFVANGGEQGNDWRAAPAFQPPDLSRSLKAIHFGHEAIHQHGRIAARQASLYGGPSVGTSIDRVSQGVEHRFSRVLTGEVVLGQEETWHRGYHLRTYRYVGRREDLNEGWFQKIPVTARSPVRMLDLNTVQARLECRPHRSAIGPFSPTASARQSSPAIHRPQSQQLETAFRSPTAGLPLRALPQPGQRFQPISSPPRRHMIRTVDHALLTQRPS